MTVDDFLGGYQVTEYLLSLGHQQIAILAEDRRSSIGRIQGYRQALLDAGLEVDEDYIVVSNSTIEGGIRQAAQLLDLTKRPSAIFACNDLLAIGVIQTARERALVIPHDLSVVGFDNTILATSTYPPLTSVAQPIYEMGSKVMDLLIENIKGDKKMRQRLILLPELVIRGSTTAPKLVSDIVT